MLAHGVERARGSRLPRDRGDADRIEEPSEDLQHDRLGVEENGRPARFLPARPCVGLGTFLERGDHEELILS